MSFHVIIPARLGSTRLPDKVLRSIAGQPMLAHVCHAALASRALSVMVATDSEDVAAVARQAGVGIAMTRADHSCGSDRIAEVVAGAGWDDHDIVVNVQADEPMMPPTLIDQVGAALIDDGQAAIATAAAPIDTAEALANPNVVKVVATPAGRALYFSRAPIPYHRDSANRATSGLALRHLGIYAYRVGALKRFAAAPPGALERCESLEQLRAFELDLPIALVHAVAVPGPGVDTEADLIDVEQRMAMNEVSVLFVCLGNICRSPTAHGVLRKRLAETGLETRISVDSAGTGDWHIGKAPDRRATAAAAARGVDITDLRARQVNSGDLRCFDYVIAMDHDNLAALQRLAADTDNVTAQIQLLGNFSPRYAGQAVGDPYFGGTQGFEQVFDMVEDCVDELIQHIR